MRPWRVRLLLLGALVMLGYWGWSFIFPGPEQVVRKRLTELARLASIPPNEAPLAKLANSQKLSSLFDPHVEITVDVPGRSVQTLNGRDEVLQAAMTLRSALNSLRVEFVDVTVLSGADRESAVAHLTAKANLPGERVPEVQELKIGFIHSDHDWLVNRVITVKTLR